LFSFSDIFYVDATTEQTLQTDFEVIAPEHAKRTVDASLRWLASRVDRNWLLLFDNADNIDLKLKKYFPSCSSGNILITTRNRELRHYTAKDADADVKGMCLEDAINLLLHQARAERSDENIALAEAIVQVGTFTLLLVKTIVLTHPEGAPWLCVGCLSSWCIHPLSLVFKWVSRSLPT